MVDISSRPSASVHLALVRPSIGTVSAEMLSHFLVRLLQSFLCVVVFICFWQSSFAMTGGITLHVDVLKGENDHHKSEAAFKSVALALKAAILIDPRQGGAVPSTKGVL